MHVVTRVELPLTSAAGIRTVAVEPSAERAAWQQLRAVTAEIGPDRAQIMYSKPATGGRWVVTASDGSLEIWELYTEVVPGYLLNGTQPAERKLAVYAVTEVHETEAPPPPPPQRKSAAMPAGAKAQGAVYMPELRKAVAARKKRV